MPAGPDPAPVLDDAPAVLGAWLHRVSSSLGAIANYVHVLPPDDAGCRDGLREAVAHSTRAMQDARGWIEAARDVGAHPPEPVPLRPLLEAVTAERTRAVHVPASAPDLAARRPAAAWILAALLDEAEARWPGRPLAVACDGRTVDVGPRDAHAEAGADVDAGSVSDRLALADALARRLGGRAAPLDRAAGGPALRWSLPNAPEGHTA